MGGDCCTWDCSSCNDGVGGNRTRDQVSSQEVTKYIFLFLVYQDPADMIPTDNCRGCYYLGYKETTTPAQVPSTGKLNA